MALVGSALMSSLSHTDQEKLFRPWWDNLEDFVVYGLITLGLIVLPTQVFSGTPLFCTVCLEVDQCGANRTSDRDPGYQAWYVRNYCTQNAISQFTQYFPYILMFLPVVLVGIERFFNRLFSSDIQIEGLSELISAAKRADVMDMDNNVMNDTNVSNTVKTVEVRQSFKEQGSFYKNYMMRTVFEFSLGAVFFAYMWLTGFIEIQRDFNVYCQIHKTFYECSGVPIKFYLYILFIALIFLAIYLMSTFFTICWLLCPWWGRLAVFMHDYEKLLRKAANNQGDHEKVSKERHELLGDMNNFYYDNSDLRLLLDLLAATSGLAQPIRVMALLDKNFREKCKPEIITLERVENIHEGKGDLMVEISESDLARNVFAKMGALSCIYTVQLSPRTDKSALEVVVFDHSEDEEDRTVSRKVINFFKRNQVDTEPEVVPRQMIHFPKADTDISYTIKVSLVLNGQVISVAQKSIKALMDPVTQAMFDAQNNALAARLSSAMPEHHHHHKTNVIEDKLDIPDA